MVSRPTPSTEGSSHSTVQRRSPPVSVASHPQKVVVVGDSLVYGFGDPDGGGWVERLRRRSLTPGHGGAVFYNLGVRGDGVAQVGQRFDHEFRHRGELRNRMPDLIILSVGLNDSARLGKPQGRPYTDFDQFQRQMTHLVTHAQRHCPVLFIGMVPVNEAAMPFADVLYYNHPDQVRYRDATRRICHTHHVPYLDLLSLWLHRGEEWWQGRLSADGLHPNSAGYRALLADIVSWNAFQTAIHDDCTDLIAQVLV